MDLQSRSPLLLQLLSVQVYKMHREICVTEHCRMKDGSAAGQREGFLSPK